MRVCSRLASVIANTVRTCHLLPPTGPTRRVDCHTRTHACTHVDTAFEHPCVSSQTIIFRSLVTSHPCSCHFLHTSTHTTTHTTLPCPCLPLGSRCGFRKPLISSRSLYYDAFVGPSRRVDRRWKVRHSTPPSHFIRRK